MAIEIERNTDNVVATTTTATIERPKQKRRNRRRRTGKKATPVPAMENDVISNGNLSDSCNGSISDLSSSTSSKGTCYFYGDEQNNIGYDELTEEEQAMYVAMDCEMVGVGANGKKSILARVTMVDWQENVLLDQFVRPTEPVTDYRTFVSGITEEDLFNEYAVDMEACRMCVQQILQGKILVGHALKNDLSCLNIRHPWQSTRDTAKYEPFMKIRFIEDGILWPRKLKDLCYEMLYIQIQTHEHSPYEDAVSALMLYKLVRTKWEKVMDYKIQKTESMMTMMMQNMAISTPSAFNA